MKYKHLADDDSEGAFCCPICYDYFTEYELYLGHMDAHRNPLSRPDRKPKQGVANP
jgi:uncharacterized C2H2 Zn-finger protein